MADHPEDNDPFEEDIVFDEAGLLGGKMPRARRQATAGFLPTFMLFIRTVFLCVAFLGLGMCVSVSGGPLIKLEIAAGVPESTAFHVFTARSVGMLLGGALGSILFEVYNRQFLLSVSLVWVAAAVTVLPFTVPAALWWTLASTAALGTGLAFLFTGGNVLCLDLWGRRQGGAALQTLHFTFSLGALVVPLVVQPFFIGLHPSTTPNASLSTLSTPLMQDVMVVERQVRSAALRSTHQPRDLTPHDMLSNEELLRLTLPYGNNQTSSTRPTGGNQTVSVASTSPSPPHSPSNLKSPKKKPAQADSSKLEPDDKAIKWTKPPPLKNIPPPQPPSPPPATLKEEHTTLSGNTQDTSGNVTVPHNTSNTTSVPIASTNTNINSDITKTTTVNTTTTITNSTVPSSNHTISATTITTSTSAPSSIHTSATTTTTATNPTTTTAVPTTTIPTTTSTTSTTTSTTTTAATTTTKAPLPVTPPTTTTTSTSTTVKSEPTTAATTTTPPPTPIPALPTPLLVSSGEAGGEVRQLTSEVQDLRERPPVEGEGEGEGGTSSLKPGTFSNATEDKSRFLEHMAQRLGDYGVTRVHLAYISIGILVVVDALVSVVVLCHHPREARSRQEGGTMASANPSRTLLFTVLFSAFMFAAEALQGALHHLLATTGGANGLPLAWGGGADGPDGQVLFWGLVCLVRFLCIPAAGCLGPPGRLLGAAVVFSVAGAAFMVVGASGRQDFVWAGVVFLAVGCAPVLPTSLLWMAQHMRVTHRLCALMVVVASFGNTLTHSLLAEVMAHPPIHALVLLGLALASACLLAGSVCALHVGHHNPNLGAPVGYQLASQHEEDHLELTPSASVVFTPADASPRDGGEAGQALLID
ncbi:Sodium-dependent glucose transporter 1 [Chionoecetes opilio]|uniref:Sodium-dependent glucose transporter 1 n=1 Tax=Chionoecetes opilio TaxID=41210 RepID=A0A8J4Y9Z2_CHIOP|nr:Sodium-dependent glucose transporter 1 [Chionoecetes opilio]